MRDGGGRGQFTGGRVCLWVVYVVNRVRFHGAILMVETGSQFTKGAEIFKCDIMTS